MEELADLVSRETDNSHAPLLDSVVKTTDFYVLSILKNKRPALRCLAGCVDGVVYANGDVSLCEFTRPLANVKEFDYDFRKLWHSPQVAEARQAIKGCFCAHPCNLIASMRYDWKSLHRLFASTPPSGQESV
jgi:MoaA/NifB/PqqE/SkfB family radical SAM enzyme